VIRPRNNAVTGFSLIEVMVAVSLLAVIIVGLLAMFYQTQRAFRVGMTQVDVLEKGRATMELIARELQEAAGSIDTAVTNLAIIPTPGYVAQRMELPGGESAPLMIQNVSFLRRVNDEWIGESYWVGSSNGVGTLYRLLVVSNRTEVAPLAEAVHNPNLAMFNASSAPIADGIVHFRVWPQDSRGIHFMSDFPPTIDVDSRADLDGRFDTYVFSSNALPTYFDVELAVLEPKSLEQFRARNAIDSTKATDYLKRQAGRIHFFKQRVPVRNGPATFSVTNALVQ
jgi:prepilin-type N-terminal cleavage/methylation domain-containing protein